MIDNNTKQKLIDESNIVEVISDFMTLQKKGVNYMGCCPFHNEKTPSFSVSPTRRIYKCFSCGKSGDVISFLMEIQGYNFVEACEYLGQKYHIEIPKEELDAKELETVKRKEAISIVLDKAMRWFSSKLDEDKSATDFFFKERGMDAATAADYKAGFAPSGWSQLYDYLKQSGFSDDIIVAADLAHKNSRGGYTDVFRGRIVFPFLNNQGKPLGFTGRTISGDKIKYLNTGDTLLFTKGNEMFGLTQARAEIIRQDLVIMSEGQFDVLALHKAGVLNAVCGSSTALTEAQRRRLFKFSHNIMLCYDGDKAGRAGAVKHIPELLKDGFNVSVVVLPDGQDPDEFCKVESQPAIWLKNHKTSFVAFLLNELYHVATDFSEKSKAINYILQCIALCTDKVIKLEAVKALAESSQMPIDEIRKNLRALGKKESPTQKMNGFIGVKEASEVDIEDGENIIELTADFEYFSENLSTERIVYYNGEISISDVQNLRTLGNTVYINNPVFEAKVSGEGTDVAMLATLFRQGFNIQIKVDEENRSFLEWYVAGYATMLEEENISSDTADIYVERCAELISFATEATRTRNIDNWAKLLKMKGAQLKAILKPFLTIRKDKRKAEQESFDIDAEIQAIDTESIPDYVEDSEEYSRMYRRFGFYPVINKKGLPVSYMFRTDGGSHTRVSDFYMEPLLHIKSKEKDENKRVLKLNHLYFNRSVYVEWKSSVFAVMSSFKDCLINEGGFNFENGTIKQYEKIWQYMSYQFSECTELKVFGQQHEGFFALANAIIHEVEGKWRVDRTNNLGIVEHNGQNYYSPAFSEIYAGERHDSDKYAQDRWLVYTDTPTDQRCTFEQWAELMDKVYKINNNGKWAILYAILCAFRSEIWPMNRYFTSVFLIGATQSGKTQIAVSIRSLFIKPEAPSFNLNSGTDAAFFSILEKFRDVPQIFEEYNDDTITDIKFQGLKSTVYDGEGKQKRKSASSNDIDTSQVNAPIILLGQEAPQKDDNALTNRVVILEVPKHDYINDQKAQVIFEKLKNYEKAGLSYLLFEVLKIRDKVKSKFAYIQKMCAKELMQRAGGGLKSGEQNRIINTVSLFLAIARLMEEYAPHLKLPFYYIEFLKLAEEKVKTQVDMIARTDKLAQFFDTIDILIDTNNIREGRDYKVETPSRVTLKGGQEINVPMGTRILYMNIRSIHSMYAKAVFGDKPLTLTTLEVNLKSHPSFLGMVSNTRFRWNEEKIAPRQSDDSDSSDNTLKRIVVPMQKQTSAAVFNYEIVRTYFDVDFEREKKTSNNPNFEDKNVIEEGMPF